MRKGLGMAAIAFAIHGGPAAAADTAGQLARLRAEIDGLIGPGRCMNLVQCRVTGLGNAPCGGPTEYLVYSWISTDQGALETKMAEYAFLQEDLQKKQPAAGACVVLPEPVAACVNNRCVLPGQR